MANQRRCMFCSSVGVFLLLTLPFWLVFFLFYFVPSILLRKLVSLSTVDKRRTLQDLNGLQTFSAEEARMLVTPHTCLEAEKGKLRLVDLFPVAVPVEVTLRYCTSDKQGCFGKGKVRTLRYCLESAKGNELEFSDDMVTVKLDQSRPDADWTLEATITTKSTELRIMTLTYNISLKPLAKNVDMRKLRMLEHGFGTFTSLFTREAEDAHWFTTQALLRYLTPGISQNVDSRVYNRPGLLAHHWTALGHPHWGPWGVLLGYESQLVGLGTFLLSKQKLECELEYDKTLASGQSLDAEPMVLIAAAEVDAKLLETFARKVARKHSVVLKKKVPLGWCSWYEFYTEITEKALLENADALKNNGVKVDYVQLDDGYMEHIGDWLSVQTDKFPRGLEEVAKDITAKGVQAGLWLAPFLAGRDSKLFIEHPDWFVRTKHVREDWILSWLVDKTCCQSPRLMTHFNPAWLVDSTVVFSLDTTHPEVQAHLTMLFQTLAKWGFTCFKLDFLTTGIRAGRRYDNSLSRAEVYRDCIKLIRNAVGPDAFLLGCGAPHGPSVGLFDAMRVSGDTREQWSDSATQHLVFGNRGVMEPCMESSLVNSIRRNFQNKIWWLNDPDCLLVRETPGLSLLEVQTGLTLLSMTGGLVVLSDNVANLSPERMELAKFGLPPSQTVRCRPIGYLDNNYPTVVVCDADEAHLSSVVAVMNWEKNPLRIPVSDVLDQIPHSECDTLIWDFWKKKLLPLRSAGVDLLLASHELSCLLITVRNGHEAQLVGNSFNVVAAADGRLSGVVQTGAWSSAATSASSDQNLLRVQGDNLSHATGSLWVYLSEGTTCADELVCGPSGTEGSSALCSAKVEKRRAVEGGGTLVEIAVQATSLSSWSVGVSFMRPETHQPTKCS